ncbi:hypothetical protein ABIF65_008549 [Bradyrhizobium japonicum]|nr:hypothetical protein [Bradyrhizobium japonicum]MCP1864356.1 hypothetical protein [Bradyrhizobium japonicum]MCP1894943.1 hypothetical protein [Bradyrhizobium japonicum]MCW2328327.1 hypothetical protein [Bradyrhizobium japonicum]
MAQYDSQKERLVRLDNPLGLTFDTPKSERNLRGSTVFREPGAHNDKRSDDREGSVPTQSAHSFSISQVLG